MHGQPWVTYETESRLHCPCFSAELQMKRHVNKVVSLCYYHLRRLFQLRNLVS